MPGFVHTYVGAEAVAVGVCAHLTDADLITSTHRGHGHCLAKGVPIAPIVAELLRPRDRPLQGTRRLDARRRLLQGDARCQRHRRRRDLARRRRGARRPDARRRPGRRHVLRRRRVQPGHLPRVAEPGGDLAAAGRLRVREQRLGRVDAERPTRSPSSDIADASRRLRHPRRHRRRGRRRGRLDRCRRRRRSEPVAATGRRCSRRASAASAATTSAIPRTTAAATSGGWRGRTTRSTPLARATRPAAASTSPSIVADVETAVVAELDAAFAAAREAPWPDPEEVERDVFAG